MPHEPINTLTPYPGNARQSNLNTLTESLNTLGQYRPIVANQGTKAPNLTRTILAGNHTWQAAKQLGWDTINVTWVDVDEHTARRIVLVDNKTNDDATYDIEALVNLATELPDLTATGFTRDELDALLETLDQPEPTPDDVPTTPPDDDHTTIGLIVQCDTTDQRDTLKAQLIARGYTCGDL